MAGLDRGVVDAAFFADGRYVSQYLINLGYGDDTKLFPRLPRFNVDEIASFLYIPTLAVPSQPENVDEY